MNRSDSLALYLRDLADSPRFSREEEVALYKKARAGDIEARNQLVSSVLPLILTLVKPWRSRAANRGIPFEDLIQQANAECVTFIDSGCFKPSKGRLVTIIGWRVFRIMQITIYGDDQTIRVPHYLRYRPDHRNAGLALAAMSTVSLDTFPCDVKCSAERTEHWDTTGLFELVFDKLKALRGRLTEYQTENWERNVEILLLYYRDGLKYQQIGYRFNLTRERIRQIIDTMLDYLRNERLEECLINSE